MSLVPSVQRFTRKSMRIVGEPIAPCRHWNRGIIEILSSSYRRAPNAITDEVNSQSICESLKGLVDVRYSKCKLLSAEFNSSEDQQVSGCTRGGTRLLIVSGSMTWVRVIIMSENMVVRAEDLMPVRSRVSWGAIFAGAVIALAVYLILTLLGSAIGLTVSDDVRSGSLTTGAGIWAIFTTGLALFAGGWVTSQCTVGENKTEAVVHGVIMWGTVLFMILWLVGTGMRAGFSGMWGVASFTEAASRNATAEDWEAAARRANIPQDTINEWKQKAKDAPAAARQAIEDPSNRQAVTEYAAQATWYTLLGTILSMATAVVGAVLGAGPSFRLLALGSVSGGANFERVHARQTTATSPTR